MTNDTQPGNKKSDEEIIEVPPAKNRSKASSGSDNDTVEVPSVNKGKSSNTALKVIIIVVVIAVLLGAIAFASVAWFFKKTADTVADSINVSQNDGKSTIKLGNDDKNFSMEAGSKELPDGFPSEVMMVEPYKIITSSKMKIGTGQSWSVTTKVDKNSNNAIKEIQSLYNNSQWENVSEGQYDNNFTAIYKDKADKHTLSLSIEPADDAGESRISYSITTKIKE